MVQVPANRYYFNSLSCGTTRRHHSPVFAPRPLTFGSRCINGAGCQARRSGRGASNHGRADPDHSYGSQLPKSVPATLRPDDAPLGKRPLRSRPDGSGPINALGSGDPFWRGVGVSDDCRPQRPADSCREQPTIDLGGRSQTALEEILGIQIRTASAVHAQCRVSGEAAFKWEPFAWYGFWYGHHEDHHHA